MITNQDLASIQDSTAYDSAGEKVGKIGQIYTDDVTGEPAWVTVSTGFFGLSESLAPLRNASLVGDQLQLGYDKQMIKDAPRVEADQDLSADEEQALYVHYGLDYGTIGLETDDGGTGSLGVGGTGGVGGQPQRTGDAPYTGEEAFQASEAPGYGQGGYQTPERAQMRARLRRYSVDEGRPI